jgi:hypothetical protein
MNDKAMADLIKCFGKIHYETVLSVPEGIQSTVRLFADDTIAYVTISSDADAANLQQDLDKLAEWELKRLMKFHIVQPFFEPFPIDGCHFVGMGPIQS